MKLFRILVISTALAVGTQVAAAQVYHYQDRDQDRQDRDRDQDHNYDRDRDHDRASAKNQQAYDDGFNQGRADAQASRRSRVRFGRWHDNDDRTAYTKG